MNLLVEALQSTHHSWRFVTIHWSWVWCCNSMPEEQ